MPPLLQMQGIVKSFPGVQALRGVDLELESGEVLALVGENGAGKSTLMQILGGALTPDAGSLQIDGRPVHFRSPADAQRHGVAVIYQEFNLIPALSAAANLFLGREQARFGLISRAREQRDALQIFRRLGVDIPPETPCRKLTVAQQQIVEIAKALSLNARILVMDEPTAALTAHEVDRLLAMIRDLKAQGLGIVYISHRLDEVSAIADRTMVLRDGQNAGPGPATSSPRWRDELIERMVGRALTEEFPPRRPSIGPVRLSVSGLSRGSAVRGVSFEIRRGEVLGLTGLVGAGRTETARLIFGADRRDAGEIRLDGQLLHVSSPRAAIAAGIGLLPEDRKRQGLILAQSVRRNFGLPNLNRLSWLGLVRTSREAAELQQFVDLLKIRLPHNDTAVRNLSGGNQQKVVLARWLARKCDVLLFDEPTRGVDVGARYELYLLINSLAAEGKAILLISSELPEVLGMADRILVMREGQIMGEFLEARGTTQEQILQLAMSSRSVESERPAADSRRSEEPRTFPSHGKT